MRVYANVRSGDLIVGIIKPHLLRRYIISGFSSLVFSAANFTFRSDGHVSGPVWQEGYQWSNEVLLKLHYKQERG